MIGFPFDSHVTYESDGTPVYDRAISSQPLRSLISRLFSNGVLPDVSTNLQVIVGSDMNVIIQAGFAIVEGCMKLEEDNRTMAIQASNSDYDRIDTVVLRLNTNDDQRYCDFYIVEGTPASSPVRPELTRTESIYELGLADIFVTKTSTTVTQQRITDTRYETERCGVISSLSQFDTTTIYNQIQADLKDFKSNEQEDFLAWLETIKNILDEDTAGNLYDLINTTKTELSGEVEDLNSKINSVKTFTIATSDWSNTTERINGVDYYTVKKAITACYVKHPKVNIDTESTLPTTAQQYAFDLIKYVTVVDGTALKLYATTKPTSDFIIFAEGVA